MTPLLDECGARFGAEDHVTFLLLAVLLVYKTLCFTKAQLQNRVLASDSDYNHHYWMSGLQTFFLVVGVCVFVCVCLYPELYLNPFCILYIKALKVLLLYFHCFIRQVDAMQCKLFQYYHFIKHIYTKNYAHYIIYTFSLFIRLNTSYPTFVLFPATLRAHILYYTIHTVIIFYYSHRFSPFFK